MVRLTVAAEASGRRVDHGLQLVSVAQLDGRLVVEGIGEQPFDGPSEHLAHGLVRAEHDVAALDVGADALVASALEAGPQVGHEDAVLAADVDTAQQRYVRRVHAPEHRSVTERAPRPASDRGSCSGAFLHRPRRLLIGAAGCDHRPMSAQLPRSYGQAMDTRTLAYIGLGVLAGIVLATLIGVPPFIWIAASIVTLGATTAVVLARSDGSSDAARMFARDISDQSSGSERVAAAPVRASAVEMELVRPADAEAGTPAVWLHRRGGRRVHRFQTAAGWVVQRVSTKDPDNPKLRVIGEPLVVAAEADAVSAADELAQGQAPAPAFLERPNLAPAKA